MKMMSFTTRLASVATLLAVVPTLAQAHPGHLDWSSGLPQTGHVSGFGLALNVIAILILAAAIYHRAPRKR